MKKIKHVKVIINSVFLFMLCSLVLGCSESKDRYETDFGEEKVRERIVEHSNPLAIDFSNNVQPILENRCVVCHGCYDSPCQLKLSSAQGVDRGFSVENIYATRFSEIEPTRLFIDAENTQEWRDKDKPFKPVLNERINTPEANLEGSVFYKMLTQKISHPLPDDKLLSSEFDLSLTRSQTCPSIKEHSDYQKDYPLGGMPYGLPQIEPAEFKVLENWLRKGAIMSDVTPLPMSILQRVDQWERRFNATGNKSQLISRYLFEHLFLAHIYFSEEVVASGELPVYFRLVRSSTPSGQPIKEIATRRPYEDPKTNEVYYRLRRDHGTVLTKTHQPYAFNKVRSDRWNELFYNNSFTVKNLPGYAKINNAFKVFKDIPAEMRYKFMLDDAEFFIMGFIKGPSCRGSTALNLIHDKFWVFFTNPEVMSKEVYDKPQHSYDELLFSQADNLELPSDYSVNNLASVSWYKYSKREKSYLNAQQELGGSIKNLKELIGLPSIWSGNENAALTIFRNVDSGVVKKGLLGSAPKTAWLVSYPVLERIHYLLVAGFDIYSPVKHQLVTRLYMDFLRIESEMAFITFLPKNKRKEIIESWYLDSTHDLDDYLNDITVFFEQDNSMQYQTDNEFSELLNTLKSRQEDSLPKEKQVKLQLSLTTTPLSALNHLPNAAIQQLAQTSFILFEDENNIEHGYTLLRHNERKNISTLLFEEDTRIPELDSAEVFSGFIGSYPQTIFHVRYAQQDDFIKQIHSITDESSYAQFLDKFAIRRTNPLFWQVSDKIHALHKDIDSIEYGLFDYNRLENR
jgi:hypothetical protein